MSNCADVMLRHNLNSNEQAKRDFELEEFHKTHSEMRGSLSAIPMCISVLGHLSLVATKGDFDLKERTDGYKHLKHPDSFRACLCQISNMGHDTFLKAESSMQRIKLITDRIPETASMAINLILSGSPKQIEKTLPVVLGDVRDSAVSCTKEIEVIVEMIEATEQAMSELHTGVLATKTDWQKAKEESKNAAKNEKKMKKEIQKKIVESEKEKEKLKSAEKSADEAVQALLNAPPTSTAKLLLCGLADGVSSLLMMPVKLTRSLGGKKDAPKKKSLRVLDHLGGALKQLSSVLEGEGDHAKARLGGVCTQIDAWRKYIESLENEDPTSRTQVEGLLNEADKIVEEARSNGITDPWKESLNQLIIRVLAVSSINGGTFGAFEKPGPVEVLEAMAAPPKGSGLVKAVLWEQHLKMTVTRQRHEMAKETADKEVQRGQELTDNMEKTMDRIANLNLQFASQEETLEVIQEGIKVLGNLKELWSGLLRYFNSISITIDEKIKKRLVKFAELGENNTKDTLYNYVYKAVTISYLINCLSSSYCQISDEHIHPLVSRLGVLISYDSENDHELIEEEKRNITNNAKKTQKKINKLLQDRIAVYRERMAERMLEIETTFEEHVEPLPEEEMKAIEATVKTTLDTNAFL